MKRNLSGTEMASKEHREIRKQKQNNLKFEAVRKNAKIHYGVKRVTSGIKITKKENDRGDRRWFAKPIASFLFHGFIKQQILATYVIEEHGIE